MGGCLHYIRRDWQKEKCPNNVLNILTNCYFLPFISKPKLARLPMKVTLRARHILRCPNVMANLLSRSNQVQSTEWSLHPQVFKLIYQKWATPHEDLFATHLNHKVPLYVSPVPDQHAWDIDALNKNWSGLTAYAYPPMALLHKVIQKIRQCNCLIILIAPGIPWFWDLVQLSTTLLKQSTTMCFTTIHNVQPPCLVSRSEQLQEQGFSVEVAERIAALKGHQQGPSTSQIR